MRFRTLTLTAGALATVLVLAGCAPTDGTMPGMDHGPGGMTSTAPSQSAAAFNAADEMFVTMMIPHHQQAIEMADQILAKDGIDERVVSLAEQIKAAQDPEIQTMQGWLSQWGASASAGPMDHGSGGMMSDDDMSSLMGASGAEFDQMWLTMMIEHHEGAIEMAQDVLATTADPDVEKLATAVVQGQEKEIATMQGMLS